jgi:hypothetical protein
VLCIVPVAALAAGAAFVVETFVLLAAAGVEAGAGIAALGASL